MIIRPFELIATTSIYKKQKWKNNQKLIFFKNIKNELHKGKNK